MDIYFRTSKNYQKNLLKNFKDKVDWEEILWSQELSKNFNIKICTHCPFCRRDTVEQNLCIICYFNFDNIDRKPDFSYENKLNYFQENSKNLSVRKYFDVSKYKDGTYQEILQVN